MNALKCRATVLIVILALGVLGVLFFGAENRWDILMSFATLLAVIAAVFLDDIRLFYHRPKIDIYVGDDLIDRAYNMQWIRGKIKNVGDRGVERCRLKLLTRRVTGSLSANRERTLFSRGDRPCDCRQPKKLGAQFAFKSTPILIESGAWQASEIGGQFAGCDRSFQN